MTTLASQPPGQVDAAELHIQHLRPWHPDTLTHTDRHIRKGSEPPGL